MQRLFSTFARGWPGAGLLLQRFVAAALLFWCAIVQTAHSSLLFEITAYGAGLLLLVGLWTPLAGIFAAVLELAMLVSHRADPGVCLVIAALGGTLAMIGPGAWSLDARLFGRKEVRL